jgi:hypothetical protein
MWCGGTLGKENREAAAGKLCIGDENNFIQLPIPLYKGSNLVIC